MTGRPTATTTACTRCGGSIYAGDRFCGSCGAVVSSGTSGEVSQPAADVNDTPVRPEGFTSYDGWERIVQRLRAATMGEFEIRRELGRGGMAIVFLAQDITLRRKVAIKLMSPGLLTNDEMVRKFREEAVMVAQMNHPNIITIHAVRNVDDLHFFIMKFVEGESLDHALRDTGPLPFALARGILYQVGSALAYAHRRGVIHRDVKPANILIDVEGDALVTDFGIAKAVDSDSYTKTGSVVGTPAYMSPEQCYAMPATWASDQYSLGVVAYEMIAGTAPFTGPSFVVMKAHADEPPPPLSTLRPDCPPELEAAVMRMLAKKPEDRFPSISQALTALGASPLPEDDPRRVDLAGIVRKAVPTPTLTPVSPVPLWATTEPAGGEQVARHKAPSPLPPAPPPPPVSETLGPPQPGLPLASEATVRVPPPDSKTVVIDRTGRPPATEPGAVTSPASGSPGTPSVAEPVPVRGAVPTPAPAAAPSGVRRRGLGIGALILAAAAVLWFVVSPRLNDTAAKGAPNSTPAAGTTVPPNPRPVAADSVATAPPSTSTPAASTPQTAATDSSAPPAATVPPSTPNAPSSSAAAPAATVTPGTAAPTAPVARSIAIQPAELTLMVGQTVRPEVSVLGADNKALAGRRVVWVSPNAAVATVDRATGTVTGVSVGTTDVRATSGDARATLRVHVEAPVVLASIAVDQPRRLTVGENITLQATPRDSRGNVMANQSIAWSSADPSVATVGANTGIVTATGPGTADITASSAGKTTTVRLSVAAPAPPPAPKAESAKAPAVDPAVEESRSRAAIEGMVQQYVAMLRAHDARRVRSLYSPQSDQDRKNEQALGRLMDGAAKLTAAEPRVSTTRIDGANASVEFSVPMTWRNPFGRLREQTVSFRAELQRDGTNWRLVSSQVVGMLTP